VKYLVYLLVLANVAYLGWNIHLNQIASRDGRELPALPAGVTPLVTLQELKKQGAQDEEKDVSGVEALTSSRPPGAGAPIVCQTIGPFLALEEMQAVSEKLHAQGGQVVQRTAEIQKSNGYWVYLPAMEREQVLEVVKVLEENRDREYYVGKGNYIALGTFDEVSRAEVRVEQVRRLGFDPVLEARYESSTAYWLDIDTQMPVSDALDALLQASPGLELQDTACP